MTAGDGRGGGTAFRLDIEGLRGLAIGLVVLYHIGTPGFDGGFVGVDIFFVISGFLITSLLLRELRSTGRIDYLGFLARRIRRLLPAALLVAVATLVLAKLVLPTLVLLDLKRDALATVSYVSNYWFAYRRTDYLNAHATASPFQQYWSLAVEEQFYLLWPILLLLFAAAGWWLGLRQATRVGIGIVLVGSLALCVLLTQVSQPWAFFGLPTRAWELAAGALIATTALGQRWSPARAGTAAWVGLGLVLLSPALAARSTGVPGWVAAVPVAGAALLIVAGSAAATGARAAPGAAASAGPAAAAGPAPGAGGAVRRVLVSRPFTVTGRLSYSIYLWHWPLLLLAGGIRGGDLGWPGRIGIVAATVVLAALTYRFVENPLRRHGWLAVRPSRCLVAGAAATATAVAATLVVSMPPPLHAGRPATPVSGAFDPTTWTEYVPANLTPPLRGARWDLPEVYRRCHSPFQDVEPADCVYGRPESPVGVVVFGDSHAANWFPPLERIATRHRIRLVWLSKSACPSVTVTVFNAQLERDYRECDRWREAALARIDRERPRLVVLVNSTNALRATPESMSHDEWLAGLDRTLDRLASVPRLTVLADTPHAEADVPSCLSDNVTRAHACALPRATSIDERFTARIADLTAEHDRQVLDLNGAICGADRCPAIVGNVLVYRDRDHLTPPFALALTDVLDDHLVRTLGLPLTPTPQATPE